MNWGSIATIYLKELKDSLRDRRTLISMIVIPTFVMPVLIFGVGKIMTKTFTKARAETPTVAVVGSGDSSAAELLRESGKFNVVDAGEDWRTRISDKELRAAVEVPGDFEAAGWRDGRQHRVVIYHYEGELKSGLAAGELDKFFRELRERTVAERLEERSLPATLVRPFDIVRENVAPPEKVGGNLFGGLVPYLIIILCFTGAMYPALDLTAGEKERGTMEALLCSPVGRADIVLGKFLMVLTGSVGAMALSLVSLALTAGAAGLLLPGGGAGAGGGDGGGMIPTIDPLGLLGVVAMVLPAAVFFSAVIFTVALFAKSYKEAQSYVAPMMIVVIMPAMVGMLPGIDLNLQLALVPILNLSLVCKEMLSGVWNWHYIALIMGSTAAYAAGALMLAVKMFKREGVIFRM